VTGGSSGTGGGTVSYSVAANTGSTSRTGTITIAGQAFSVTQAGAGSQCTYSLTATSRDVTYKGGKFSIGVMTSRGCSWTARSNTSWITITSAKSGTGNARVYYKVAAKSDRLLRTGTITVAGITHTVYQQ
jgi:hypothetical protein